MRKILITLLICLLTCAQVPFAFGAGHEQTNFYDWSGGVSQEGWVALYYQGDSRGGNGDTENVLDILGLDNHSNQVTASKQAGDYATEWIFDGTDDKFSQERLLYLTGVTLEAMILGGEAGIRSDVYDLPDLIPSGSMVVLTDSSGATKAMFYAGGAASAGAETLGSENVLNGGFDSGTTSWTAINAILSSEAGGQSGNCLQILEDGDTPYAYQSLNTVRTVGKLYKISWYVKQGTETTYRSWIYTGGASNIIPDSIQREATGSWVQRGPFYYTCDGTDNTISVLQQICAAASGTTILFDTVTHKEITNLGATGLTCFSGTTTGASQSFNYIGTGFPWNAASGYTIEVYRPGFNFRGSFAWALLIQPDDGQPAADQTIIARWGAAGLRSYMITLDTSGKIDFSISVDGSSSRYRRTDAAVFSDGAQYAAKLIICSYDNTTKLATIYVNGMMVASTQNGGAFSGLQDTPLPLLIGATDEGNYFAGKIKVLAPRSQTVSAGEAAKIYSACVRDGLL